MIITPLIDIDYLNLSKIEPLWSMMTKGEKLHKDKVEYDKGEELCHRERYDKGKGSIKILSTQVGGASS